MIDERRQGNGHVAIHELARRRSDLVSGQTRERGGVSEMQARQVVKPALEPRDDGCDLRKRAEPRTVAAGHGVLADEAAATLDICKYNPHGISLRARVRARSNEPITRPARRQSPEFV